MYLVFSPRTVKRGQRIKPGRTFFHLILPLNQPLKTNYLVSFSVLSEKSLIQSMLTICDNTVSGFGNSLIYIGMYPYLVSVKPTITRLVVDRDKTRNLGLWFIVSGLLLIMFFLTMVN